MRRRGVATCDGSGPLRVIGVPASLYSPTSRAEHLIAAARALLAVVSLLAIWIDPTEPSQYAFVAYPLLAGYGIYALALWFCLARLTVIPTGFSLVTHVVDLLLFASLQHFTTAASSPFFVYFLFALVAATMRWQLRGVMWTGALALAGLVGLGLSSFYLLHREIDVTHFLVRASYLVIMTALLAYLGAYEERLRTERARLTAWPPTVRAEDDLPSMLGHAARVLGAPRLIMMWERTDEPWRYVTTWLDGKLETSQLAPDALPSAVPASLAGAVFLSDNAHAPTPKVLCRRDGRFTSHDGAAIDPSLQERWGITRFLALPLVSQHASGWLLALDKRGMTSDDLLLGELAAREISARLDRADLLRSLEEAGAARERERLAGDLHDGLLQSLTGIDLKLEQLKQVAPSVRKTIEDLQETIAGEHRDLREFVRGGPDGGNPIERPFDLETNLRLLPERIGPDLGTEVIVRIQPGFGPVPSAIGREIYMMVREAVANALKHSGAKSVRVDVRMEGRRARIVVADDGRGFPFTGRYADEELRALRAGPRSLLRRARELTGRLHLESAERGVRLEIELPVPAGRNGD
jgi:signal transduction histidine kinase